MEALIAQRKVAAAEARAAEEKVESLDAEIRAVAAQLAGNNGASQAGSHNVGINGTNGASGHVAPSAAQLTPAASTAREASERERLAPRKAQLLKLLLTRPEADLAFLAIRMYGNEGRSARVNVSSYFTDLKAEGYVEPGSRPGTFVLTAKGLAVAHQ